MGRKKWAFAGLWPVEQNIPVGASKETRKVPSKHLPGPEVEPTSWVVPVKGELFCPLLCLEGPEISLQAWELRHIRWGEEKGNLLLL